MFGRRSKKSELEIEYENRKLARDRARLVELSSHSQTVADLVQRRGLSPLDQLIVLMMAYKTLRIVHKDELHKPSLTRYARVVEESGLSMELAQEFQAFEEQDETRDRQDDHRGEHRNNPS